MGDYAHPQQKEIAAELGVREYIAGSVEKEASYRVHFLQKVLLDTGMRALVLGISGGVDSLVAGRLCQMACEGLGEGYRFIAVKPPYRTQRDAQDAEESLPFIKPDEVVNAPITDGVDGMTKALDEHWRQNGLTERSIDFHRGNIKARLRMVAQYALAASHRGLVVGTDHASEAIMGFFTKHGDGACDVAPLAGLIKQQVREIGDALGAPPAIIRKSPTADLEDLSPNRPDEEALGVSYDNIERFLHGDAVHESVYRVTYSSP